MTSEIDRSNMQIALELSRRSKAIRAKVGCLLVTTDQIMIGAYNGTPSGWDNCCEDVHETELFEHLVTKSSVIHSELNAILHAARQGVSVKGATLYVTLSPCVSCSAMISQVGIKRVVYLNEYRDTTGVDVLREHGIIVDKLGDWKQ